MSKYKLDIILERVFYIKDVNTEGEFSSSVAFPLASVYKSCVFLGTISWHFLKLTQVPFKMSQIPFDHFETSIQLLNPSGKCQHSLHGGWISKVKKTIVDISMFFFLYHILYVYYSPSVCKFTKRRIYHWNFSVVYINNGKIHFVVIFWLLFLHLTDSVKLSPIMDQACDFLLSLSFSGPRSKSWFQTLVPYTLNFH